MCFFIKENSQKFISNYSYNQNQSYSKFYERNPTSCNSLKWHWTSACTPSNHLSTPAHVQNFLPASTHFTACLTVLASWDNNSNYILKGQSYVGNMTPTSSSMLLTALVPQGIRGTFGIRNATDLVMNFYSVGQNWVQIEFSNNTKHQWRTSTKKYGRFKHRTIWISLTHHYHWVTEPTAKEQKQVCLL